MSIQLTLEQEWAIIGFAESVKDLSREEAQKRLVEMYTQMLHQEARYISLLGKTWGMTSEQP